MPQVLDNDVMLKLERKFLLEMSTDLSRLLEPVSDLDLRIKLLSNYGFIGLRTNDFFCYSFFDLNVIMLSSSSSDCAISWLLNTHK